VMQALSEQAGEARALASRGKSLSVSLKAASEARETAQRVAGVLSTLADERDAAAREQVEALVSAGLQAIFGEAGEVLSFHMVKSTVRNATSIEFEVHTTKPDGEVIVTDVMSARGGGVAAVIGVLLRVVLLLLTRRTGRPVSDVLVLDESLAHLSADRLEAAGEFLRTLVDRFGMQILMITHQEELVDSADVVYKLSLDAEGVTRAVKVR
jgi:hypothetical protein